MASPIITFTSDFGLDDWFVGVVHGVLHEGCPQARIVDLSHAVEPGDVRHAAFILEAAAPDFPPRTVHLLVVDPGVGTARRALAISAHGQYFVAPDNGILEWALRDTACETRSLTVERFFRRPVSRTFHGRDVFAPVAAALARGVGFEDLGQVVTDPVRLEPSVLACGSGEVRGCVMFVDRFGNCITNITAAALADTFPRLGPTELQVQCGARQVTGIKQSYGDAPLGTLVAIVGSTGHLEVAQTGGSAASRFGIGEGDVVTVRPRA